MPLLDLKGKPLTLMGAPAASEVQQVQDMAERVAKRNAARMAQRSRAGHAPARKTAEDSQYTFLQVRPLQGLPNPDRSQKLLLRLKEDPGIRAAMKKHKFTVGLSDRDGTSVAYTNNTRRHKPNSWIESQSGRGD
ncbi:hypothetical protein NW754_013461 [Fusarium falciforme]|nr:hypothetical protein NW754_013461 [Fusarium falciforme]